MTRIDLANLAPHPQALELLRLAVAVYRGKLSDIVVVSRAGTVYVAKTGKVVEP